MRPEAIRFDRPLLDVMLAAAGSALRSAGEDAALARAAELARHAAEVAAAREAGVRQGRAEADAAFTEQLMTQRQEVLGLAEGVLRKLSDQQTALSAQARACVPDLVMNIVRRVLAGIDSHPAQIQRIIEQALAEAPQAGDQPLEVFLCPSDLAMLESLDDASLREKHPRMSLRADASLSPTDCLVRGNFGLIDGRMETKLQGIQRLLENH